MNVRIKGESLLRISESMVGCYDKQQVIPYGQATQAVHESTQTAVGIGKRIGYLVIKPMVWNLKGLMAAQAQECLEPKRVAALPDLLKQMAECNVVIHAPGIGVTFRCGEIRARCHVPESGLIEPAVHVREVYVTSIGKVCGVPLLHQFTGYRRQSGTLDGQFHDGGLGEGWPFMTHTRPRSVRKLPA